MPTKQGEINCARSLTSMSYPRFHLFVEEGSDNLLFKLHLDQKRPSYSGVSAHNGEYEGEIIEKEAKRIKNIIQE